MQTNPAIAALAVFLQSRQSDLDDLVALRIAAMQPSLEQVGRFDPQRARERFAGSFLPSRTFHIMVEGQTCGFFSLDRQTGTHTLRHLYLHPRHQQRGIGSQVIKRLLADASRMGCAINLAALRESPANRFYRQHGFQAVQEEEWDIHYTCPPASANSALSTHSSLRLRWLERSDLSALEQILRHHVRDLLDGRIVDAEIAAIAHYMEGGADEQGRYRSYLVACDTSDQPLGCAALSRSDTRLIHHLRLDAEQAIRTLELLNVFVHHDALRQQGIGRALVAAAAEEAMAAGARQLLVNSGPRYRTSWGFYDHLFDMDYGMLNDYYGPGRHAKVWSKQLGM